MLRTVAARVSETVYSQMVKEAERRGCTISRLLQDCFADLQESRQKSDTLAALKNQLATVQEKQIDLSRFFFQVLVRKTDKDYEALLKDLNAILGK